MLPNAAILTKHHKLPLIAEALGAVGVYLCVTEDFDTDTLGTFAGEVPRTQSPLECVKTKAKLAAELTGLRFGIGSEGSFGGGPLPGLVNWDDELLAMYDSETQQFIIANAAGPVPLASLTTNQLELIQAHIEKSDQQQGWMCTSNAGIAKGLIGYNAVVDYLSQKGLFVSATTTAEAVTLSPDLRAHLCPVRQQFIQQAAGQLAERIKALCPRCGAMDFWRKAAEQGLACEACDYPTAQVQRYIKRCDCCQHIEFEAPATAFADPAHCPRCNP